MSLSTAELAAYAQGLIPVIERVAGMKFERIGAPQPQDMAKIAAERTVEVIRGVDDSVVPYFTEAAQRLLDGAPGEEGGAEPLEPVVALAKALAKICGHTELKRRSLISANEEYVTLQVAFPTKVRGCTYMGPIEFGSPSGGGGGVSLLQGVGVSRANGKG